LILAAVHAVVRDPAADHARHAAPGLTIESGQFDSIVVSRQPASYLLPRTIGHIQQPPNCQYVAQEFTDRHIHHDRRPEWQFEPTGQGADQIADARQLAK
jgi:hypothetical protein